MSQKPEEDLNESLNLGTRLRNFVREYRQQDYKKHAKEIADHLWPKMVAVMEDVSQRGQTSFVFKAPDEERYIWWFVARELSEKAYEQRLCAKIHQDCITISWY